MPSTLRNNKSKSRFELEIDDYVAFVDYAMPSSGAITLLHTEVPKELGGRGVGSILAKAVLENIRSHGLKVEPQLRIPRRLHQETSGIQQPRELARFQ